MSDGSKGHHEKSQSLDIDFRSVRDEINRKLHYVDSSLTPYIGLERARKILAPYSVFIPATNYMEGSTGVRTFNVVQFNNLVGMTNDGKVQTKTESPYHIYFDYSECGGMFCCRCKLLTADELETYMDNYASENINEEKDKKEKKVHPLVARVKHAHISDAWMHARRNNDAKFMDTIKAKLKIKGLPVSDDEIKDSIEKFNKEKPMRPHKDKKKDLSEAIARYIERLDELTAPTWKNTDEVLKRARDNTHKLEKKSFRHEGKADRSAMYASMAKKLGLSGIAAKFKKKELEHEKMSNDAFHGSILNMDKQINATNRQISATGRRPMKEDTIVSESAKALGKQVRKITGK